MAIFSVAGALGSAELLRKKSLEDLSEQTAGLVPSDMGWVLICSVAVYIITPGIGLFYAGMIRKKNALSVMFQSYFTTATISLQWYLWGYSLAASPTGSSFLGNMYNAALINVEALPFGSDAGTIPAILYWIFSVFFPICTAQIFVGAVAERGRLLPSQVIAFCWVTVVYCPLAYWTWSVNGWLAKLGALDFAGGGPVHIASGWAALAYSLFLGKRKEAKSNGGRIPKFRPHSPQTVFIGVTLIWFGWLTFNSGTLLAVNTRTAYIMTNTQLAASSACITWIILDRIILKKFSIVGACEGAVAGLVAITPSCAFLPTWAAVIAGIVTSLVCRLTVNVNNWIGIDDTTYAFNLHGIGGMCGGILLGLFASPNVAGLDGVTEILGGWTWHHWKQMGYQLSAITSISAWSFCVTYILCFVVNYIPGLQLRASEEEEEMGMDFAEMYEVSENYDLESEAMDILEAREVTNETGNSSDSELKRD